MLVVMSSDNRDKDNDDDDKVVSCGVVEILKTMLYSKHFNTVE